MNRKTVLISGASRGIGRAAALAFAREHYNLIITCQKNKELLEQVKQEAEAAGSVCLAFAGDMGDFSFCKEVFEEAHRHGLYPDLVINNAGISYIGLLQDMSPEEWDRIIRTNLTSVFNCSKLAIPHMLEQKSGKILSISSVWGNVGASCEVAYSATKGGINSFTRALAKELAPSNVQVNAVACGAIDTDMNHFLEEEELEALKDEIPAGRLAKPEEVADLLLQLAQSSSYLTGQIIGFDGGVDLMPTTYSHYRFGKDVYEKLTPAQKAIIDPYRGLYDLGLHRPDLLFYYHPFSKNRVSQTGVAIHERSGIAFFLPAVSRWRSCRHKKAALAYLYGVLCHFALDSTCHPYVEASVRRTGISHSEIEAEMDRRNMEKDNYNPLTHRPANHLRSRSGYAETIAVFYPKQSVRQIDACIHSIRICCNLFVIPNLQMRSLILKFLKLVHFPKVIREMIIKCRKNPDCDPICQELDQLYTQAVPTAVELIQNLDEVLKGNGVFDSRLQHTFGEF